MFEIKFTNKIYKGALFLDELMAAAVDATTVRVETAADGSFCRVFYENASDESAIRAVEATHDAAQLSKSERLDAVRTGAKDAAAAIPNWATWTAPQATDWLTANIADVNTRTALIAMARMLVALRNARWPDLQA